MQPTVSHDNVSTEKLEKKKKVVKDTAALKTNLTFREGLFPFRKKKKKVRPATCKKFRSVVCGEGHHILRKTALLLLSVWSRLNCTHTVINTSQRAVTGIQ